MPDSQNQNPEIADLLTDPELEDQQDFEVLKKRMGDLMMVTATELVTTVHPFVKDAEDLKAQSERAEIKTVEDFAGATDMIKICNAKLKDLNDRKLELTQKMRDRVSWVNTQVKPIVEMIQEAKTLINKKGTAFQVAENDRIRKEAAEAQRRADEEAIKDAEEAAAQGDQEKADAIIDAAADTPPPPSVAPTVRGGITGASGSLRQPWVGEVESVKEICAAIGRGDLSEDLVSVSKSKLNDIARQHSLKDDVKDGSTVIWNGIKIYQKVGMNVR